MTNGIKDYEAKWNELSDAEKLKKLEPRVIMMIYLLRKSFNILKDNDLKDEEIEKGLKILNLDIGKDE